MGELIDQMVEFSPAFLWLFLVVALVPLFRVFVFHSTSKNTIHQKNLELLLSAYDEGAVGSCEKLVVESLISGIYKRPFMFPVIEALLKSSSPKKSFDLYNKVSPYVVLTNKKRPFRLRKKYAAVSFLGFKMGYWVSIREFLYYMLSSMASFFLLGLLLLVLSEWSGSVESNIAVTIKSVILFLCIVFFLMVAFKFLRQQGEIRNVKAFLRLQLI